MQSEKTNQSRYPGASMGSRDWHTDKCYACGTGNERGLEIDVLFDENVGEVNFEFTPDDFMLGAPGYVHGGVLSAIMDESQGVLCFHIGHMIMTDELHLKYHKATPLHKPVKVHSWMTAVRKRRLYTRATMHSEEGELLCASSARWYLLPEKTIKRIFYGKYGPDQTEYNRVHTILEANRKRAKDIRMRRKQEDVSE